MFYFKMIGGRIWIRSSEEIMGGKADMIIIKNNLRSLMVHMAISFLALFVYMASGMIATAKWVSEEAALRHHNQMVVSTLVLMAVMLIIYYIAGKALMEKQAGIAKKLASTSLVIIFGIVLWILGFSMIHTQNSGDQLVWSNALYNLYISYAGFYLNEIDMNNKYIYLLFSFLPSVVMALGMIRIKKEKNHE